jgi:single-stranded-DNA-specific exonuclease
MNLSLTNKYWHLPQTSIPYHRIIETLYTKRGLSDLTPLLDASVFPDTPKAINRILQAIAHNERIKIFGDYDCDGITSTAQLVRFFERQDSNPLVRLPHRERDGYGLKEHIVHECIAQKIDLLLTVDTGISSTDHIAQLQKHGIDVIILDHHTPRKDLPPAYAILHPIYATQPIDPNPAAAGLVFSFLQKLEQEQWDDWETDIALACIGTVADLVELKGSNRTLVKEGTKVLSEMKSGVLVALMKQARIPRSSDSKIAAVRNGDFRIASTDIAYRIAPRINAAGRMDDPCIALKALLEGGNVLRVLDQLNQDRQRLTEELFDDAYQSLGQRDGVRSSSPMKGPDPIPPFICLAQEKYSPGIVGLIAGRLTERFARPSLVANVKDEICTASVRSIPNFDVASALTSCRSLLLSFGGHPQAAGCTFEYRNLEKLQEELSTLVLENIPLSNLTPTVSIDGILNPEDITLNFCEDLNRLEPFGKGNPEPRFLIQDVKMQCARQVGSDGNHLQGRVGDIKSIGFGLGELCPHTSESLDLICHIGIDEWNGKREPQIFIEDIRLTENRKQKADFRQGRQLTANR